MPSEYRQSSSWNTAIGLGPKLMQLAEDMPAAEELGLSLQLRQLMVELPSAIASDLTRGGETRHAAALKLVTVLELVDRVYPALDTQSMKTAVDNLAESLSAGEFSADGATSMKIDMSDPAPASPKADEAAAETAPVEPSEVDVVPVTPDAPADADDDAAAEAAPASAPPANSTSVTVQVQPAADTTESAQS